MFPVNKLDLELAWKRVKADLQGKRSFIHPPFEIELIDAIQSVWLGQLRERISAGYRPQSVTITDIPKGNGAIRPAALLSIDDRVVYSAAIGAILSSINSGLAWSQGRVDFSYRLSGSPRRVEWFTNIFNSWTAFRKASIERIENGASHVVLTDITGFYENIDLSILFSDLRSLGCDTDVIQLLQTMINRWCVIPGRGLPQGLSPSDVLAKVYLNPVDQALRDIGIDYIRYVDDIRIFCHSTPESKKALMFLIDALRRRGLNLQTAKTHIASAEEAKNTIEGVTPVIAEVQQKYKEFLEAVMESVSPYMTISEIDNIVDPEAAPVEVVREVFRLHFSEGTPGKFNRTLFHYLLKRLGGQRDEYALDYCLKQFAINPQETQTILDYAQATGELVRSFSAIEAFLNSPDCIYDYQIYQLFQWLNSIDAIPINGLIAIARSITFDNSRSSYLRAACRVILQRYGTMADLDRLEASYGGAHHELEKAQILVSLKRMEVGRRNSFYGRVAGDGLLCEHAIRFVKEQRL